MGDGAGGVAGRGDGVRLQGALANLGHKLSDTTVGNILREHGIEPGEEVGRTAGRLQCRKRLGGMLRYYYRAAA